ncbi:oligosaccharide repeat unit polymerase [Microbacterium hominis]|uniref:O-antigen polymerase n=1 Tax=Microbacterium hominis TaxID=162426 RepID=UPI001966C64E|nr:O-antigen polymerase [Microbacterium hominis]QRY41910.1 oligosaccharide repeat unit polymerase [Microbacterium hominis]
MDGVSLACIALLFILLAILSAHRSQSWLAPAPVWNLCWAALFAMTAALGYGFYFPTTPVAALVLLAATYNVPAFVLNSAVTPRGTPEQDERSRRYAPPAWLLLVTAAIGFLGLVKLGQDLGTSLFSLRSLDQLFSLGQQNAVTIFRGEASFSFVVNITFAVLQLGGALAGVRIALRPTSRTVWATLPIFLIAFLWSSVTTQRSYLLVPVVWFAAGYIAAEVWKGKRSLPSRAIVSAAAGGAVMLLLIVFLRAVRTGGTSAELSEQAFAPTRLWLAGYVPTFSAWYEQSESTGLSFGLFNGVVALVQPLLGGRSVDDSGDGNFYYIGEGLTSNAGTIMMRIVGTGGLAWGALTVLTLGLIAQVVYRRAARGSATAAALYVGVIAFTLWSTNAWFLGYGGRVLALAGLLAMAWLAGSALRRERNKLGASTPVPPVAHRSPAALL